MRPDNEKVSRLKRGKILYGLYAGLTQPLHLLWIVDERPETIYVTAGCSLERRADCTLDTEAEARLISQEYFHILLFHRRYL